MWSSKSGRDLNANLVNNNNNDARQKRSEASFNTRVMAEASDKLNNDLKI